MGQNQNEDPRTTANYQFNSLSRDAKMTYDIKKKETYQVDFECCTKARFSVPLEILHELL